MRITVFSPDVPFPANRGGRADVWRRILSMCRQGNSVQLVSFYDDEDGKRPTDADMSVMKATVDRVSLFPIRKDLGQTLARLPRILKSPWHAVCRTLNRVELAYLLTEVRGFGPDVLWCESPWCGNVAEPVAAALAAPLLYRSHNIEHKYIARQAAVARSPRDRLAWTIACFGLERFESRLMKRADWVFDISSDDMAFWQARGIQHISWLPPVSESSLAPTPTEAAPAPVHDVVFLGNLATPNNVRGIEWLLQEIRPRVLARRPGTRFIVAGSRPGPHVRQLCTAEGVQLMPDVDDALALYRSARVLVNPVRTGSGTHMKAIEMLMMAAPIVTASQGTMGMPPEIKRLFRVADTADDFAGQVLDALANPQDEWAARAEARRLFSPQGVADALDRLGQRLATASASAQPMAQTGQSA